MFRRFLLLSLPLFLVVGAVFVTVLLVSSREGPGKENGGPQPRLVTVQTVQPMHKRVSVRSQGTVSPRTETVLVAEVAGVVEAVSPSFVAGGFFRKGDVLLRIDPSDYEAGVKRAEAELAAASATLAQEIARADQARKDWNSLERTDEPSELVLRKPYVDEARARVKAAEANLAEARRDLERTRIRAPYDGLVREKAADVGQYVGVGTRLGTAFAVDYAEVRLPLSLDQRARITLPSPAEAEGGAEGPAVRLSATSNAAAGSWEGRIVRSEGVVDPRSRVVHVVAQVRDPYRRQAGGERNPAVLEIGTFVTAEIEGVELSDVYGVPREALTPSNELLVVDVQEKLRMRPVEVAWSDRDRVYVRGELEPPVRIVTSAIEAPVDGMAVRLGGSQELEATRDKAIARKESGND